MGTPEPGHLTHSFPSASASALGQVHTPFLLHLQPWGSDLGSAPVPLPTPRCPRRPPGLGLHHHPSWGQQLTNLSTQGHSLQAKGQEGCLMVKTKSQVWPWNLAMLAKGGVVPSDPLRGQRGFLRVITLRTPTSQNAHYEMPGFIKGAKSEGRGCSYARPWGLQPCSLQAGGRWGAAPSACFQIPTCGRQKRREKCQAEKSLGMRTRPRGQCQAPGGIRSGSLPTRGRPGILCIAQPPKAPPSPKTASCWGSWLPWCHCGHRWPTHRVSRSNLNIISVLLQISFCLGEIL